METRADFELVAGIKKGDEASFQEIVSRYTQKVYNLAMRLTRNQEDAEEVLQDVFITVHQKIESFEGKSAFSSWLYRVTANTAFMKLRKRRSTESVSFEDLTSSVKDNWVGKTPDDSDMNYMSIRHELRDVIEKAVKKLPQEYLEIFVLRDIDGLSNEEVGEILKLSVPAVKSRLHRARLILRKRLQRYYEDYSKESVISFGKNMTRELSGELI